MRRLLESTAGGLGVKKQDQADKLLALQVVHVMMMLLLIMRLLLLLLLLPLFGVGSCDMLHGRRMMSSLGRKNSARCCTTCLPPPPARSSRKRRSAAAAAATAVMTAALLITGAAGQSINGTIVTMTTMTMTRGMGDEATVAGLKESEMRLFCRMLMRLLQPACAAAAAAAAAG
jgi:hypothetical protein